jgi:DNA-3-methyladenine glycosylase I
VAVDETSSPPAGADGRRRCWWSANTPEYISYHDEEWGRPALEDDLLFEHLCLEAFQSGLSWLTILRKRQAFRAAFADFHVAAVAEFGERDVERLLGDAGIIRNRRKIEAAIHNAACAQQVIGELGSLAKLFWRFRPPRQTAPRSGADIPAATPESKALADELRRRGFVFVGPTTAYAGMQACGIVNDHLTECWVRDEVQREQEAAARAVAP